MAMLSVHASLILATLVAIASLVGLTVGASLILRDPRDAFRRFTRVVVHTLYRLDKRGLARLERFAAAGPGVVVANHVSYMDAVILGALAPRPMRFVMDHRIFKLPVVGAFFRFARAIPIASAKEDPALKEGAFAAVRNALAAGETVCIFPEGRLTRDGASVGFRPGIERILAEHPAPVLPIGLTGLWGSWLSYAHGAPGTQAPRRLRARVGVHVGRPLPAGAHIDAALLEEKVGALVAAPPQTPPASLPLPGVRV